MLRMVRLLGLSFCLSQVAYAQYDLRVVEADIVQLNTFFNTHLTVKDLGSLGELKLAQKGSLGWGGVEWDFSSAEYIGYFSSKDTIEYVSEAILGHFSHRSFQLGYQSAYLQRRSFFDDLVSMVVRAQRVDLIYDIIKESVAAQHRAELRVVSQQLLRSLVYQFLFIEDEFPLDRLLDPTSHSLAYRLDGILSYQPQAAQEFKAQQIAYYVLRDLAVEWTRVSLLSEEEGRFQKMNQIIQATRRFKTQILRKESLPSLEELPKLMNLFYDSSAEELFNTVNESLQLELTQNAPQMTRTTSMDAVQEAPGKKAKTKSKTKTKTKKISPPSAPVKAFMPKPEHYLHFGQPILWPEKEDRDTPAISFSLYKENPLDLPPLPPLFDLDSGDQHLRSFSFGDDFDL